MSEEWLVSDEQIIDTSGINNLSVKLIAGRIDVVGHEAEDVRIEISEVKGQPIEVRQDGSSLSISHLSRAGTWFERLFTDGFRGTMNDSAVVTVLVPRRISADIGTISADGMLSGVSGAQSLKTVSGAILTSETAGDLRINMVNGDISVQRHRGTLSAKATNGEITASGDMTDVNAKTVNGDVTLDLEGAPPSVTIKTVSGNALVRIPEGVGVALVAKTVSGRVTMGSLDSQSTNGKVEVSEGPASPRTHLSFGSVSGNVSVFTRDEMHDGDAPSLTPGTEGGGLAE
ncbi:DUF4097 family beta strand repeat-containing protein [Haematomicrobium sanguinis]|uniref:DUF4097 family beta strand repeat-containing protein n=1 Tax=Haematomicrobium sanguinis TaxID=479106 RepID=UPI00068B2FC1|nr:DUF4097 family beta strand repeat-containing protein [Haematomicrobium sanguinis]